MFDAANAEEMFLTSTSLCILPVRSFNGAAVGDGKIPGPITKKLIDAYSKERRLRLRRPVPEVPELRLPGHQECKGPFSGGSVPQPKSGQ